MLALVILTVATAIVFDFTNGFHDTANAMATTIATRALAPRIAVGLAAVLNLIGLDRRSHGDSGAGNALVAVGVGVLAVLVGVGIYALVHK